MSSVYCVHRECCSHKYSNGNIAYFSSPSYCHKRVFLGYDDSPVCLSSFKKSMQLCLPLPKFKQLKIEFDYE